MNPLPSHHPLAGLGPQGVAQRTLDAGAIALAEAACARQAIDISFLGRPVGKAEMLTAIATALRLPQHFGGNLDALFDCLTDIDSPQLIVLRGLPRAEISDEVLDVLRDAAEDFAGRGLGFIVLYDYCPK